MNLEKEKLLVISPHADDEVMGCFGLINKIKNGGGKVYVQILSLGGFDKIEGTRITKEEWKNEVTKVSKFLNIDKYEIANFNDEIIVASDAFFPFVDGIETLVQAGISAVIQPAGSIKDKEIIKFANQTGTILVFSKTRHFKH